MKSLVILQIIKEVSILGPVRDAKTPPFLEKYSGWAHQSFYQSDRASVLWFCGTTWWGCVHFRYGNEHSDLPDISILHTYSRLLRVHFTVITSAPEDSMTFSEATVDQHYFNHAKVKNSEHEISKLCFGELSGRRGCKCFRWWNFGYPPRNMTTVRVNCFLYQRFDEI